MMVTHIEGLQGTVTALRRSGCKATCPIRKGECPDGFADWKELAWLGIVAMRFEASFWSHQVLHTHTTQLLTERGRDAWGGI